MNRVQGGFCGADSCDLKEIRRFDSVSRLLENSESLSLKCQPDMKELLRKLRKGSFATKEVEAVMTEGSEKKHPGVEMLKCVSDALRGSTFVVLIDAIEMGKACKEECHAVNVVLNRVIGEIEQRHFVPVWPSVLVFCHEMMEWGGCVCEGGAIDGMSS